ncbi:MAG: hypothetical protein LUD39_06540 [Opitutae bacterium]|nr:hypothetical protein [Opitutae bacterium]MCD8299387.1 hypothetical protein [Opitutae bacterium]
MESGFASPHIRVRSDKEKFLPKRRRHAHILARRQKRSRATATDRTFLENRVIAGTASKFSHEKSP